MIPKKVLLIIVGISVLLVACINLLVLGGTVVHYKELPSRASIKAVGVGVFWDPDCTDEVEFIDWGVIEPSESVNVTVFILGTGNVPVTLSMSTDSWIPANASDYVSLSWTLEGSIIEPQQVLSTTLTLHVSSNISGITDFSFNIIIRGVG